MDGEGEKEGSMEADRWGGQGPPRAVAKEEEEVGEEEGGEEEGEEGEGGEEGGWEEEVFTINLALTNKLWVMEKYYLHIWIQR